MSLFDIFKFPPFRPPYVPTLAGDGTQMTDAGIPPDYVAGDTAGGHRGSAGQGKCRRDPGATLQCIPECSWGGGVTACGAETLPRATLGNTTREVK
ncbi:unnamed protein product [Staurois parvus]|uniref:Uncharacterized protein n=1 Tax=Staurois parvus TaxID=386267 RepID=A0ABN9AZR2_9NEOB|nr:unnamed protein product [Staurois parvus]